MQCSTDDHIGNYERVTHCSSCLPPIGACDQPLHSLEDLGAKRYSISPENFDKLRILIYTFSLKSSQLFRHRTNRSILLLRASVREESLIVAPSKSSECAGKKRHSLPPPVPKEWYSQSRHFSLVLALYNILLMACGRAHSSNTLQPLQAYLVKVAPGNGFTAT
jgi:hypothetical protein